jgi:hypothetical protein
MVNLKCTAFLPQLEGLPSNPCAAVKVVGGRHCFCKVSVQQVVSNQLVVIIVMNHVRHSL